MMPLYAVVSSNSPCSCWPYQSLVPLPRRRSGDPAALAAALRQLADHRGTLQALRHRGNELARQDFTPSAVVRVLLTRIDALITQLARHD